MDTLRETVYTAVCKEGSLLHEGAGVFAASPVLEASKATAYFLEGIPDEQTFSLADIPLERGLRWLWEGSRGAFIETSAPPETGMAWATLLTNAVDRVGVADAIQRAGPLRAVDTEVEEGDPGLALMEPGLIERAGAFVYLDDAVGDDRRRNFYEYLVGGELEVDELSGMLQLMCFAEISGVGGNWEPSTLIEPTHIWYLPVDNDGRLLEVGEESSQMMMVSPGASDPERLEEVMDTLAEAQRPLILSTLFVLGCAGAALVDESQRRTTSVCGEDSLGEVYEVQFAPIQELLERHGQVSELGFSHALTVCRESFEGP